VLWAGLASRLLRLLAADGRLDGRIVIVAAVAVYLLVVAVGRTVFGVDVWPALGVPSGPSLFFDTRNITAALECHRLGYDPLFESPCDPWNRPMNYPRAWLVLRYLGINQSHTDLLAVIFIVLFLVAFLLVVGRLTLGQGLVGALAICSPSVMFAIERANMDIVIFTIMAGAVLVWRSRPGVRSAVSPALVTLGAIAKIYPVFALPVFLMARDRATRLVTVVCGGVFAVYVVGTRHDIAQVASIAPQGTEHAFGARILPAALLHLVTPERWGAGEASKQLIALVPLALLALFVWVWARRRLSASEWEPLTWQLFAFGAGSLIFLGTFAIGNNFDYRLVFLLLTLPQLFAWAMQVADRRSGLAAGGIIVLIVFVWIGALSRPLALFDELATWAMVSLLTLLIAATLPPLRIPRRKGQVRRNYL
jgi:hypothetical protein